MASAAERAEPDSAVTFYLFPFFFPFVQKETGNKSSTKKINQWLYRLRLSVPPLFFLILLLELYSCRFIRVYTQHSAQSKRYAVCVYTFSRSCWTRHVLLSPSCYSLLLPFFSFCFVEFRLFPLYFVVSFLCCVKALLLAVRLRINHRPSVFKMKSSAHLEALLKFERDENVRVKPVQIGPLI